MSRPLPGYGRPTRIWDVLAANPTISYEELVKLDVESQLIEQPAFGLTFRLSDRELSGRLNFYIPSSGLEDVPRLAAFYLLHAKHVEKEFAEYLDTQPLEIAVKIVSILLYVDFNCMHGYLVQRMPVGGEVEYVKTIKAIGHPTYLWHSPLDEAIRRHTKNYNEEVVKQLLELVDQNISLIPAVVPYAPDWMLQLIVKELQDQEVFEHLYEAALENSEERLSHIMDFVNKYVSYQCQLEEYVEEIEYYLCGPENYGTIVMMLLKKLGRMLSQFDVKSQMFKIWKFNVLNGQV